MAWIHALNPLTDLVVPFIAFVVTIGVIALISYHPDPEEPE